MEAKEIKQGNFSKIKWRTQILELEWLHVETPILKEPDHLPSHIQKEEEPTGLISLQEDYFKL